ncbi:MAG TPA: hypothetical protein EYP60_03620, partial [bacterium (Candidatus Stahlbacteria)]|nr:hypothetical protein [Candidatus Stahlbacteria bacterium]
MRYCRIHIVLLFSILTSRLGMCKPFPIIFVHGNKGNPCSTEVWKTWNDEVYKSVMQKLLEEGYRDYQAGIPLNCHKGTWLGDTPDWQRIYNFCFYNPDGDSGAIGSNGHLVPKFNKETYQEILSHGSWAEHLADFIEYVLKKTGAPKVNIVAHCEGGLVAKAAICYYDCYTKVDKLLLIATPNHGVDPNFVVYLAIDYGIKWPLWMHRGEGREIGIDKQVRSVTLNTTPPFLHIEYGETYDVTFENQFGESGTWCELLKKDWEYYSHYVDCALICGNWNPYHFLWLGYGDGVVEEEWCKPMIGADYQPTILAAHSCGKEFWPFLWERKEERSLTSCAFTLEFIKRWMIDDSEEQKGAVCQHPESPSPNKNTHQHHIHCRNEEQPYSIHNCYDTH